MPMSINRYSHTVVTILQRAANDAAFRSLLVSNPGAALSGYTLVDAEHALFSGLTAASLDSMIQDLP